MPPLFLAKETGTREASRKRGFVVPTTRTFTCRNTTSAVKYRASLACSERATNRPTLLRSRTLRVSSKIFRSVSKLASLRLTFSAPPTSALTQAEPGAPSVVAEPAISSRAASFDCRIDLDSISSSSRATSACKALALTKGALHVCLQLLTGCRV